MSSLKFGRALRSSRARPAAQLESQRAALETIETEFAEQRNSRQDAETALTEVIRELETVGARLVEAREQESALRETLSTFQEEAASLSEKLAQAEVRIQEARSAEADMHETAAQTSQQVADLEAQEEELTASVSDLSTRLSDMQSDVSAAEEQRAKVQSELQDVTQLLEARSDDLVKVESRIAEKVGGASSTPSEAAGNQKEAEAEGDAVQTDQGSDGASETGHDGTAAEPVGAKTPDETAQATAEEVDVTGGEKSTNGDANIMPGTYRTGDIEARLGPDGVFHMRNKESEFEVSGNYSTEDGIVTLSNPEGELRHGVNFPLRCAVESKGDRFSLDEIEGIGPSCGPLSGVTFEVVQR